MDRISAIEQVVFDHYTIADFPAMRSQFVEWSASRPLSGMTFIDATPVYRNTLPKYAALLAAGAEVAVFVGLGVPCDEKIVAFLKQIDIEIFRDVPPLERTFDAVGDCAGRLNRVPSRLGYVELTRSGCSHYQNCAQSVYVADSGRIKLIETALGTGNGLFRALQHFGYRDFAGKRALVFGCGKVGRGVAFAFRQAGAVVTSVDDPARVAALSGTVLLDRFDTAAVRRAIAEADYIVSATALAGALANWAADFNACRAVMANIGVEDEFGPGVPPERVLNGKVTVNFALDEPTQIRYIDPSLALHNFGFFKLLEGKLAPGLNVPATADEEKFLAVLRRDGAVAPELDFVETHAVGQNN